MARSRDASVDRPRSAGYSGTPLFRKLGIAEGSRVKTGGAPDDYLDLIAPIPPWATVGPRLRKDVDIWHLFVTSRRALDRKIEQCIREIRANGAIWVSWPKRSSGLRTDMTEDVVREIALPLGLVDVKVCAVDQTWSALKLVIRRELRGKRPIRS